MSSHGILAKLDNVSKFTVTKSHMLLPCSYQFQFHARIFSRLYSRIQKRPSACARMRMISHIRGRSVFKVILAFTVPALDFRFFNDI